MRGARLRPSLPVMGRWSLGRYLAWAIPLALIVGARLLAPLGPSGAVGATAGASRTVVVDRAVDGDTVLLTTGEWVRYLGIDTPELHHPNKPVQPYAREAWAFNRRLVDGRQVRLEFDVQTLDQYHRLLAYVFLEDGTFVNAELLRQGYAVPLTIPPNVHYRDQFLALHRKARAARRGVWADPKAFRGR